MQGLACRLSNLVSTPRLIENYWQQLGHDQTCIWRRSFCCVFWGWGGRGQVGTYCSNTGEIYQDRGAGWWCWRWRQLERCERCSGSSWLLLLVGVNGPKDRRKVPHPSELRTEWVMSLYLRQGTQKGAFRKTHKCIFCLVFLPIKIVRKVSQTAQNKRSDFNQESISKKAEDISNIMFGTFDFPKCTKDILYTF